MASPKQNLLSQIPAVEILLRRRTRKAGPPASRGACSSIPCARRSIRREPVARSGDRKGDVSLCPTATQGTLRQTILADARQRALSAVGPHYRKVINATGIILHTALGRAVLPAKAMRQIEAELSGYSLLQADIATGERSKRDGRIESLLQQLTGAEAATVVNNNAAATSIVLNTVARGREVIVSRGQLVEIGGSFRLPDVMAASGVKMVEVGTTNKTHARDYEKAITPNTAAILRVHPSNYKISGFTSEVPLADLVRIGHAHGLVVIDDVGAGPLMDFSRFGFEQEPTLQESVHTGADLTTASADKLIGASQGGIILGRADLVQASARIRWPESSASASSRWRRWRPRCRCFSTKPGPSRGADAADALPQPGRHRRPGRSHRRRRSAKKHPRPSSPPPKAFPKWAAARCRRRICQPGSSPFDRNRIEAGELAARLRAGPPPVFARVHKGELLLDPRTLLEGEEEMLVAAVVAALQQA